MTPSQFPEVPEPSPSPTSATDAGLVRRNVGKRLLATALATALVAGGCGGDGAEAAIGNQPDTDGASVSVTNAGIDGEAFEPMTDAVIALPDGWFEMAGYGTVLHVDGDHITPHFVTTSTCVAGERFDNELPVDHAADDGVLIVDLVGPTTDYRLLPLTGGLTCESDRADTVQAFDELFSTHYPFFAQRGIDLAAEVATIRGETGPDGEGFEPALDGFMVRLGDGHTTREGLDIDPDLDRFGMDDVSTMADVETLVVGEFEATLNRLEDFQTDPTGVVGWGHLTTCTGVGHSEGAFGYLVIAGFEGASEGDDVAADRLALTEALDMAIADLDARFDRLIVDVRFNQGGYEDFAVDAAGYFVSAPAPAYRKWAHAQPDAFVQTVEVAPRDARFRGDVVVLTSPITASAAEAFTLAMREATEATLVGTPTFGEFSDAIDWVFPDGTEITLSMENYTDLAGTNHEAVGIPVDIEAPFDQTVEAAVDHLMARSGN